MNLIFGKYQIILNPYLNLDNIQSQSVHSHTKLCISKFNSVYGFGPTRILWVLAVVGSQKNSRIASFYSNSSINKEKYLSKIYVKSFSKFVGLELKQAVNKWKSRSKIFGVRRNFFKKIPVRNSSRKKKLSLALSLFFYYHFLPENKFRGVIPMYRCFV